MFNINIIKHNVSKQFVNYLDNVNCPIKYCIDEYKNIKCNSNNNNSNKSIYLNDHLLLINNNQSMYNYNNNKKDICPNCNLFSLYHKTGMKWLICLNCFKRFCYFCLKHYKYFFVAIKSKLPLTPNQHIQILQNKIHFVLITG